MCDTKPNLISKCICGITSGFAPLVLYNIPLLECECGIIHQKVKMTKEEYVNFYNIEYHTEHQTKIGCEPYVLRYMHDVEVAKLRLKTYSELLGDLADKKLLDIGSGNGAFVDSARAIDIDAYGLDLGVLGNPKYTYQGGLENQKFQNQIFDLITLHDVLEHMIDPLEQLRLVKKALKVTGHLIIDFPNYWVAEGKHHWRLVQHLWYFKCNQLKELLEYEGFTILGIHTPIPSKLVFYCKVF